MTAQLTGSEKQVAWAEQIRAEKLVQAEAAVTSVEKMANRGNPNAARALPKVQAGLAFAQQQTSARWWIDNRYVTFNQGGLQELPTLKA